MSGPPSRSSTSTTSPTSSRSAERSRGRYPGRPGALTLLASGAAVAAFAIYFLVVRTYWGQRLDEYAFAGRAVVSGRAMQADHFLRVVSVGSLLLVTVLIAAVAFARSRPRLALIAAGSIVVSLLSTEILKLLLLERPPLVPSLIGDNSYPSGHATVGMAVGIAGMLVVPARLRMLSAFGATAVASAFGVAVIAAGWHRPSDVVGAYLVCLASGAAAAGLARAYPDRVAVGAAVRLTDRLPAAIRIGPTELGLFVLALALAGVFGLAVLTVRGIPWTSAGAGFLISSSALVVIAGLVCGALAVAMATADAAVGAPSAPGLDDR